PVLFPTGSTSPVTTATPVYPNGSNPGSISYPDRPVPFPTGLTTPIVTGIPDDHNGSVPDFNHNPNNPDHLPFPTASVTPDITQYPGNHDSNGPDPTPIPYYNPDMNGPNYYNGRYSYPDDYNHYRYESSPLYAPRYDKDNGAIQVISTPTGATVYLNNNYEGRTPSSGYLGISSLTPGNYQIVISYYGYADYTTNLYVYQNQVQTINAVLEPVSSVSTSSNSEWGTLDIQATPDGAIVLLNNVYRGTSPLTIQGISPGAYNLTILKDGYTQYASDVAITSGQTTAISTVLTPVISTGSTQIPELKSEETVVPIATQASLPGWILITGLIIGGLCAIRKN
ncbi:MAG: PEGA domain-containing protein, partial [Methanospirillum sp.]|uniref:PEGA domain-containing protein n=1 Tax=Methanospirillum sp. TaxID=45200 RepID=UPI00236B182B